MQKLSLLFCYVLLISISCVDPYDIPVIPSEAELLVVEGFINSNGPTTFQLSHTVAPNDKNKTLPEQGALISIEGNDHSSHSLKEKGNGVYTIDPIDIDPAKQYRIRIRTSSEEEYLSDFVDVKQTPNIDSVTWHLDYENRGIQFYLYTHDAQNAARYYHWEYFETFEYHALHVTHWEYINGQLRWNPDREQIYQCWKTVKSSSILTATTSKLTDDVVYRFPLLFIPANSEKVNLGYRILIHQYAVTREDYDYLQELKKNTEQGGTIFDRLPSHLTGNITNLSNPERPALGYVSSHDMDQKSIFIDSRGGLPPWIGQRPIFTECDGGGIVYATPAQIRVMMDAGYVFAADAPLYPDSLPVYTRKICVDCREYGGTNIKPDFWPE